MRQQLGQRARECLGWDYEGVVYNSTIIVYQGFLLGGLSTWGAVCWEVNVITSEV